MFLRHFLEEEAGGSPAGAPAAATGTPSAAPAPSITADPAGGVPAGGAAPAGASVSAPPASSSWMDSLPDEIKRDPSIQLFKESGVGGLAKSWVSAQAMLGKEKVIIPGEKATDEEWGAFYAKLGRPESADKYEFKMPDGQQMDEGFAKGFKELAFKTGMNPKQVQNLAEWYGKEAAQAQQQVQQARAAETTQKLDAYRTSLGGEEKFKVRIDQARVAVRALADPKLNEFLDKSGAGSQPEMIEFFAKLSGMMGEDKLRDGTGVAYGDDPAAIQKEITSIESRMYSDMGSSHRPEWVAQLSKLYERLIAARQPRQ